MAGGDWARQAADDLLRPLGDRWLHVQSVAAEAELVARCLSVDDRRLLVESAWLHDVGYAPSLHVTGFHPLDGAIWLTAQGYDLLAGLVAHHSCASVEAGLRDLDDKLDAFGEGPEAVVDALAYCDMTSGPAGERVTLDQRIAEVRSRYGADHMVSCALEQAEPCLAAAVARTQVLMAAAPPG